MNNTENIETIKEKEILESELFKRIGNIKINLNFILYHRDVYETLMQKLVILNAKTLWDEKEIEYISVSEDFDLLEKGEEIPEYSFDYNLKGIDPIVWFVKNKQNSNNKLVNIKNKLMKCGHTAQAIDSEGNPVCAICIGIYKEATEIDDAPPSLTGRRATCSCCSGEADSNYNLPFFRFNPEWDKDMYYCGCRGWD